MTEEAQQIIDEIEVPELLELEPTELTEEEQNELIEEDKDEEPLTVKQTLMIVGIVVLIVAACYFLVKFLGKALI